MDLLTLLSESRIEHRLAGQHHHVSDGWVGLDCPKCSPDSGRFRLGINLSSLACSCWVCGKMSTSQVLSRITSRPQRDFQRLTTAGVTPVAAWWVTGRYTPPSGVGPLIKPHRDYLRDVRGFDPDALVADWGVAGTGLLSEIPWRIFIPIFLRGKPVSWTARAIGDFDPRYWNARPQQESVPRSAYLYGQDKVRGVVVVHEGPTDVWRTGAGAVALRGLKYTAAHLHFLSRIPRRIICLDSAPEAQRVAELLCQDLSPLPGVTFRVELDAKDAGSASEDEIRALRKLMES